MSKMPSVSEKLRSILEEFVYNVLKEDPPNLYAYSAKYFKELYDHETSNGNIPNDPELTLSRLSKPEQQSYDNSALSLNEMKPEEDDDEDEDDEIMDIPDLPARYSKPQARRHSVAAESVDPEKIDFSKIKVYPKTDEQKTRLNETVKKIFIFRSLEQNQIPRLIDAMLEKNVEAGETVIKQGDDGDNFYVIENGTFEIFVDDEFKGTYNNEGSFGELALMYNTPRAATIVAKTAGVLWAMDRESFLNIVLHAAFKKRRMYEELLASASILKPLTAYERTNLADALISREYKDGEEICHFGDPGNEMFFIENGQVEVYSRPDSNDGSVKHLHTIHKGDYFGELALITDGKRNATVKAAGDVRVAVLDRSSFERLMGRCVDLMKGQSKTYLEEIKSQLGEEALAQYPALLSLLNIPILEDSKVPGEAAAN